jgi:hypothetical protein
MAKTNVEKLKDYLSRLKPGEKVQPAVLARKYKVNRRYIYTLLANEFPELETLGRTEAGKLTQESLTKKRKTTPVKFPTPVGTLRSSDSLTRDYVDVRWPSEKIKNEYIKDLKEKRSDVRGRKGLTNDEFAKKYFGKINTTTKSNVERINNVLQKQLGIEYEDAPEQEVFKKRLRRLDTTVGQKAKYLHGTDAFPFHHIMPIGGEVDLTTNDISILSKKMNSKLAPYNKKLNDIADAISNNFNEQPDGYLKRIDELNNNAEQIIAKATKELPKKFQPYIGFTKLDAITDEYGTPINLQQTRIGAVKEKGIPLRDLNTEQLTKLKSSIKKLTEKEKIAYCSVLSRGGLPGDCAAAIDNDPVKAAQVFDQAPATSSAMTKVKNAATGFLKSGGFKTFGAGAAVGTAIGLVKAFRNDDPTTYLSNEDQQKSMLVDMATQPISIDMERPAILDYQLPALGATLAGTTALGAPSTIKASKSRALGIERKPKGFVKTGARVLGRGLGIAASPALLAPFMAGDIASQVAEGDSITDIATDPLNYTYPIFAEQTDKLTRGLNPTFRKFAKLGLGKTALKGLSRAGIGGLAASLAIQGVGLLDD